MIASWPGTTGAQGGRGGWGGVPSNVAKPLWGIHPELSFALLFFTLPGIDHPGVVSRVPRGTEVQGGDIILDEFKT